MDLEYSAQNHKPERVELKSQQKQQPDNGIKIMTKFIEAQHYELHSNSLESKFCFNRSCIQLVRIMFKERSKANNHKYQQFIINSGTDQKQLCDFPVFDEQEIKNQYKNEITVLCNQIIEEQHQLQNSVLIQQGQQQQQQQPPQTPAEVTTFKEAIYEIEKNFSMPEINQFLVKSFIKVYFNIEIMTIYLCFFFIKLTENLKALKIPLDLKIENLKLIKNDQIFFVFLPYFNEFSEEIAQYINSKNEFQQKDYQQKKEEFIEKNMKKNCLVLLSDFREFLINGGYKFEQKNIDKMDDEDKAFLVKYFLKQEPFDNFEKLLQEPSIKKRDIQNFITGYLLLTSFDYDNNLMTVFNNLLKEEKKYIQQINSKDKEANNIGSTNQNKIIFQYLQYLQDQSTPSNDVKTAPKVLENNANNNNNNSQIQIQIEDNKNTTKQQQSQEKLKQQQYPTVGIEIEPVQRPYFPVQYKFEEDKSTNASTTATSNSGNFVISGSIIHKELKNKNIIITIEFQQQRSYMVIKAKLQNLALTIENSDECTFISTMINSMRQNVNIDIDDYRRLQTKITIYPSYQTHFLQMMVQGIDLCILYLMMYHEFYSQNYLSSKSTRNIEKQNQFVMDLEIMENYYRDKQKKLFSEQFK